MKLEYKIGIIGGVALCGVLLISYFNRQMNLLRDACYTVAGAIINEITFNKVSFTMILNISNKSDIDFSVTNQAYNVYVNGMLVAKIDKADNIKVLGRGRSTVNINVAFNPQDLLKQGMQNIATLIDNKNNMIIEIKGYLSLRAGAVSVKDYQVDERLTLGEMLAPNPKEEECKV
jgi:LEA14-like dessication related protein